MRDEVSIPHNGWAFITEHKGGGKYLYVGKKELTMSDVFTRQNKDTLVSIKRVDVGMVIIFD
jgi:hypothetical protein